MSARTWIASLAVPLLLACGGGPERGDAPRAEPPSLEQALLERDPLARAHGLSGALARLGPDDLENALATLERRQFGVTPEEVRWFMLAWARFDAPGALAWARSYPSRWSLALSEGAAFAWGHRDGPAAFAHVEALEDEEERARLRSAVMDGWIRSDDKAGAAAHIAAQDDPRRRRRLTFVLVGEARTQGIDALQGFVESLPDELPNDFKQGVFYHASVAIARSDPRRAADWLAEHGDRFYSVGAAAGIARAWASTGEYEPLFAWLRGLPADGDERRRARDEAVADAFRAWVRDDADAAESWLAGALPDPGLDPAIRELVRKRTRQQPARAVDWALRIEDETLRRRALQPAVVAWARVDLPAASAWLDEQQVDEAFRSRVLKEAGSPAPPERALHEPGRS